MSGKKSVSKDQLIEAFSRIIGDSPMGRKEAITKGSCCKCGGDAKKFKDAVSIKEYSITGWCQTCQDNFYEV